MKVILYILTLLVLKKTYQTVIYLQYNTKINA
jgi:hypothetical protein